MRPISKDSISMRELLVLLFVGLLSPAIQTLPSATAPVAGEAAWLSAVAALPGALILCWILLRIGKTLPEGAGLGEAFQAAFGKLLGKAAVLLYLLWGLLLLGIHTRLCAQRFLSTTYRNTPLLLFIVVLLAVVLWMARGKLAAFARAGEVFYLILALTLGAVLVFGAGNVEGQNVFPIWVEDVPATLHAAVPVLSSLSYAVYGAVLAGGVRRRKLDRGRAFRWTVGFCLVLAAIQFVIIGNFGPELVERMEQPFFMMVKGIGVQGVFQRAESVVMALWVLSDLVFLGLLAFACRRLTGLLLPIKQEKSASIPVILAAFAGAVFLFPNGFALNGFINAAVPVGNITLGFAVPAAALLALQVRKGR